MDDPITIKEYVNTQLDKVDLIEGWIDDLLVMKVKADTEDIAGHPHYEWVSVWSVHLPPDHTGALLYMDCYNRVMARTYYYTLKYKEDNGKKLA